MERFTLSLDAERTGHLGALTAKRGVRRGQLNVLAIELARPRAQGDTARAHGLPNHHVHLEPAR